MPRFTCGEGKFAQPLKSRQIVWLFMSLLTALIVEKSWILAGL